MNLYLLSLGCARNMVDSEIMMGRIKRAGWTLVDEPEEADAIVVNTCRSLAGWQVVMEDTPRAIIVRMSSSRSTVHTETGRYLRRA